MDIDANICDFLEEMKQLSFKEIVTVSKKAIEFKPTREISYDFDDEPDFFKLTNISRYSCACHKLNLVLSKSIDSQEFYSKNLDDLQKLAIECKSNSKFAEARCSPKLMNATRWFSQYSTILWAKKSYQRSLFDSIEQACPFNEAELDILIQILLPAYNINLVFQQSTSWIGDVIPYILKLKSLWSRQKLEDQPRELCYFLVSYLEKKFEDEINSNIYKVIIKNLT